MEAQNASIDDNLKIYPITNRSIHLQSAMNRATSSDTVKQVFFKLTNC
jgi:hypothetical protein